MKVRNLLGKVANRVTAMAVDALAVRLEPAVSAAVERCLATPPPLVMRRRDPDRVRAVPSAIPASSPDTEWSPPPSQIRGSCQGESCPPTLRSEGSV
jgi:hypothetical protein